jgi:hypothetical protein
METETSQKIAAMTDEEVWQCIIREAQRLEGITFEDDPRPKIP